MFYSEHTTITSGPCWEENKEENNEGPGKCVTIASESTNLANGRRLESKNRIELGFLGFVIIDHQQGDKVEKEEVKEEVKKVGVKEMSSNILTRKQLVSANRADQVVVTRGVSPVFGYILSRDVDPIASP